MALDACHFFLLFSLCHGPCKVVTGAVMGGPCNTDDRSQSKLMA
jgi:hypothetical protein